jgi:hypothetical protein
MPVNTIFATANTIYNDLKRAKELLYGPAGFNLSRLEQNAEGTAYGACSFVLDGKTIQQRVAKITPTKTGQFVAIWKRNKSGQTAPFDFEDDIDFLIIVAKRGNNFGQFIFPKLLLANQGIISRNGKGGKRGIRVYPPWDSATNKQAQQTQSWQINYFLTIGADNSTDLDLAKQLFAATNEMK